MKYAIYVIHVNIKSHFPYISYFLYEILISIIYKASNKIAIP